MFNTNQAIHSQAFFCKEKGLPYFVPKSGKCYRCNQNIYEEIEREDPLGGTRKTGISVERASNTLITGCPHCNYSFCD